MRAAADLTVADVEKAIGITADRWSGNCYAIACAILRAKLVKGRPAYGHWTGPVHPKSMFARGLPFVRHGWIVLEERGPHAERPGSILDPTRWVFEEAFPYIYVGSPAEDKCSDCGYTRDAHGDDLTPTCSDFVAADWPYDEGGDRWRQATQRPMPDVSPGEKVCVKLALPRALRQRLKLPVSMTVQQAAWVANLPFAVMGRDAWTICQALAAAGHKAYVPQDTWTRAEAERGL